MNYFKLSKFLLITSVFAIIIVVKSSLFPFIVGKYSWFRVFVDLSFIAFILGLLIQDKGSFVLNRLLKLFKNPLVISVSIFTVIFLLACFFGIDSAASFWSNFERGEGGIQIVHLYLFFILCLALLKEEKDWFIFFNSMIIVGMLSILYGIFAGFGSDNFIGPEFGSSGFRFFGTIGNPAYLAAFMIFLVFYGLYLLITKYRDKLSSPGSLFIISSIVFFTASFFAAATRGAFIGLIASLIAFAIYLMFSKKSLRKWLIVAIIFLILIVSIFVYFKDSSFIKSIPGSRIFDISLTTQTFQHRAIMWGIAIEGWKERPVLGWGPENYLQVFSRHFDKRYFNPEEGFGAWFDRAHSIYFDYLVETGILGLLSFISIFIVFYLLIFKRRRDLPIFQGALLFAVPIAYLVQGMALFDVLPIYINLFLILAFGTYKLQNNEKHD